MTVPFSTSDQSDVITPWTQFFGNHLQSVTINNSQEDLANNLVSGQPLCMGPGGRCLGIAPLSIFTHLPVAMLSLSAAEMHLACSEIPAHRVICVTCVFSVLHAAGDPVFIHSHPQLFMFFS